MIDWIKCSGLREGERYDYINGTICNRKLLLFDLNYGMCTFEIKCPRCSAINELHFHQPYIVSIDTSGITHAFFTGVKS